ncbi:tripartite tricarboxylate transporter TctB family protein [Bacillus pinisoli]|uniref:tripartite tricarboxylate transporter TctB family protein n=1 Tax=Bacillus pinisoli TaxID=2901866 RepID=UPI001FF43309|nr:tripartite tricarboxylate transporter TctB family protein [Bacillus pinisoli]
MKIVFSTFLFVLSLAYTQIALGFNFYNNSRPGPGFLPTIVGILLVIFTGLTLYQQVKAYKQQKAENVASEETEKGESKDVAILIVLIALSVLLLNVLGGLIVMLLFVFANLHFFNKGKHLQNIITSVVVSTSIFLLFELWLNAGIPKGFLNLF